MVIRDPNWTDWWGRNVASRHSFSMTNRSICRSDKILMPNNRPDKDGKQRERIVYSKEIKSIESKKDKEQIRWANRSSELDARWRGRRVRRWTSRSRRANLNKPIMHARKSGEPIKPANRTTWCTFGQGEWAALGGRGGLFGGAPFERTINHRCWHTGSSPFGSPAAGPQNFLQQVSAFSGFHLKFFMVHVASTFERKGLVKLYDSSPALLFITGQLLIIPIWLQSKRLPKKSHQSHQPQRFNQRTQNDRCSAYLDRAASDAGLLCLSAESTGQFRSVRDRLSDNRHRYGHATRLLSGGQAMEDQATVADLLGRSTLRTERWLHLLGVPKRVEHPKKSLQTQSPSCRTAECRPSKWTAADREKAACKSKLPRPTKAHPQDHRKWSNQIRTGRLWVAHLRRSRAENWLLGQSVEQPVPAETRRSRCNHGGYWVS